MAVPPLPLPTPGQNDWAGPLNESLEILNQGIGDVNDAATAAENARDAALTAASDAQDAADAAEAVGATNDAIMTSVAQDPGSDFSGELTERIITTSESAQGVVFPAGAALGAVTYSAIQDACDLAASLSAPRKSVRVVASGTITTDQTLVINSEADLSTLEINYTGSGIAVQIGKDTTLLQNVAIIAPKVVHTGNVVGTNWVNVGGTVGLRVVNISQSTRIEVPYVGQFETGLLIDGRNNIGNAYNEFHIGNLYNNKRNLVMDNDGAGWTTQNLFIGGRYAHATAEGAIVAGVEQILILPSSNPSWNATSNNKWVNPSIEGNVPQYHLSLAGRYNIVDNARLETGVSGVKPRVRWYDGARYNTLIPGYGGEDLDHTVEGDSAYNFVLGPRTQYLSATGPDPALAVEKAGLSTAHLSFFPSGHRASNSDYSNWIFQANGRHLEGRRSGDAFARSRVNWYDGEFRFGDGTIDPNKGFRNHVNGIQLFGGDLVFPPANDIGVGAQRPRRVRTGEGMVLPVMPSASRPTSPEDGLTIIDSTLNKTITYYKTEWRDADGTAV